MELIQEIAKEFDPKFEELNAKASDLAEQLEQSRDSQDAKAVEETTAKLTELQETVQSLTGERDAKLREAERESMKSQIVSLQDAVQEARAADLGGFTVGGSPAQGAKGVYGPDSDQSFFADVLEFSKGSPESREAAAERWQEALEGKAMTQGTSTAGGYLVPDQISSDIIAIRAQRAVLRGLFPSIQVNSDTLRIASVTSGLTAGWVAELATKPVSDFVFGEISANVFTAAGTAVASNQLLRNARQSVDRLVNADLALRLGNLEEVAFISGSGTGQPLGLLNTSGINTVALATTAIVDLLDAIVDAVTAVYSNYFGAPNAIVMHPRTWARIVKARESGTSANYLLGPGSNPFGRRGQDDLPGYGEGQTPRGSLFGLPVYTTANIPTNLGAGTNESRVIVGNFSEGLILENQGITLDQSEHVYFTTNQTIFRAEEQVGFTAARYPKAFSVVQGAGLAAG